MSRHKIFKHLEVEVYGKIGQVDLNINQEGWRSTVLPLVIKPKKLAKELRKIAKWLEKR